MEHGRDGPSGSEWAEGLFRGYRPVMPRRVSAVCDALAELDSWEVVAVLVLDWAMTSKELRREDKARAIAYAHRGFFGRHGAEYERRLSSYRPPIHPPAADPRLI